jgi:hypothetical protein
MSFGFRQKMRGRGLMGKAIVTGVLAASVFVSGCATVVPDSPERTVRERAQARWTALLAGDIDAAYSYLPPSYRAIHDIKYYRGTINNVVERKAAEVVSVECKAEVCTAKVRIDAVFAPMANALIKTFADEKWIVEDGAWWHFQD